MKGARRSFDKNWTSILVLFAVAVVVLGTVLYLLVFRDSGEPETEAIVADGVATEIDSTAVGAGAAAGAPQLQFPIRVTVTASGNGLQSFRVSQNGDRAPYWINAGESQTFEADSSLTLWGEGTTAAFSEASLELQGLRWTPADGRPVTISRATGQRVLDSLATAGAPAAPDTTAAPAF